MSHERNLTYLNNKRLIYRRHPVSDKPDIDTKEFMYYKDGTHQCYELFRSTAKIVYEVSMSDLDRPPKNKLRKVIFKPFSGLTKEQKLSIVGQLVGQSPRIQPDDIYSVMVDMHDNKQKITIARLAKLLSVSSRTIHRHMCVELKKEKELLNQQL
jgi:hypothetical protein